MYPTRELTRLAAHKSALRRDMAHYRVQCVRDAQRLARPLQWMDRVATFWQRLSPLTRLATVPLGIIVQRTISRRLKTLRAFVRWGTLFLGVARVVRTVARLHSRRSAS